LEISPLLFGNCAISLRVPRFDGEDVTFRLEPRMDEYDGYGRPMSAPVIGEAYASRPETDADRGAKRLDGLLYPGMSADEMDKARRSNAALMGGQVDAIRHLAEIEIPTALPRRGTDIAIQQAKFEAPPLSHTEAARALRALGVDRADLHPWLVANWPEGVPEAALAGIAGADASRPSLRAVGA
jgi:hypothetical protein